MYHSTHKQTAPALQPHQGRPCNTSRFDSVHSSDHVGAMNVLHDLLHNLQVTTRMKAVHVKGVSVVLVLPEEVGDANLVLVHHVIIYQALHRIHHMVEQHRASHNSCPHHCTCLLMAVNHIRSTCKTSLTLCDITPFFVASFSMSCIKAPACNLTRCTCEQQLFADLENSAPSVGRRPSSHEIFQELCHAFLPGIDHAFYSASLHAQSMASSFGNS